MLLPDGTPSNPSNRPKNFRLPDINRGMAADGNKEYIVHTFKQHASFAPARLVVNTRESEQKSVVVVAEEGRSYRVFGLRGREKAESDDWGKGNGVSEETREETMRDG